MPEVTAFVRVDTALSDFLLERCTSSLDRHAALAGGRQMSRGGLEKACSLSAGTWSGCEATSKERLNFSWTAMRLSCCTTPTGTLYGHKCINLRYTRKRLAGHCDTLEMLVPYCF